MGAVRLLALLFSLAACWLARDLLVPIMLGMLLALLANPMVTRLTRIWIPRWLGALVVVLGGLALAVSLASLLVGPASDWVKQAPTELRQLAPKLKKLTKQVEQANKAAASIVSAAGAAPTANAVASGRRQAAPAQSVDADHQRAAQRSPRCWRWCCCPISSWSTAKACNGKPSRA